MLIQQVQIVIAHGRQSAFETALLEVRQAVFRAPGFRRFDVAQDTEQHNHYQAQVFWETAAELTDFVATDQFERAWAPVQAFLTRPLLIDVLLERPSLDLQGPGVLSDAVSY